jgi:hypothetical protein
MHSDASLEALGYHFGSGTKDLAAHQSSNSHMSRVGLLRFSELSPRPSRGSTLVLVAAMLPCRAHGGDRRNRRV